MENQQFSIPSLETCSCADYPFTSWVTGTSLQSSILLHTVVRPVKKWLLCFIFFFLLAAGKVIWQRLPDPDPGIFRSSTFQLHEKKTEGENFLRPRAEVNNDRNVISLLWGRIQGAKLTFNYFYSSEQTRCCL